MREPRLKAGGTAWHCHPGATPGNAAVERRANYHVYTSGVLWPCAKVHCLHIIRGTAPKKRSIKKPLTSDVFCTKGKLFHRAWRLSGLRTCLRVGSALIAMVCLCVLQNSKFKRLSRLIILIYCSSFTCYLHQTTMPDPQWQPTLEIPQQILKWPASTWN